MEDGMLVGIDSGTFCSAIVHALGQAQKDNQLKGVRIVPTSRATGQEATFAGVPKEASADHEKVCSILSAGNLFNQCSLQCACLKAVVGERMAHSCFECSRSILAHVSIVQCMQLDMFFAEVDVVDVTSPALAFIIGRSKPNAQPQLPRFRAAAKKAARFVALIESKEQVQRRQQNVSLTCQQPGQSPAHQSEYVNCPCHKCQLPVHLCWNQA